MRQRLMQVLASGDGDEGMSEDTTIRRFWARSHFPSPPKCVRAAAARERSSTWRSGCEPAIARLPTNAVRKRHTSCRTQRRKNTHPCEFEA